MSYSKEDAEKQEAMFLQIKKNASSGNDITISSRNVRRKKGKETFSERLKRQQREKNLNQLNKC